MDHRQLRRGRLARYVTGALPLLVCVALASCSSGTESSQSSPAPQGTQSTAAPGGESSSSSAASGPAVAAIKTRGQLLVATTPDTAPWSSVGPDGQPQGFDIDLAKALAKSLGVEAKFQLVDSPGRVATLQTKKSDVVIADFTATAEREKVISFSNPYVDAAGEFMVLANSPYTTLADLKSAGAKVTVCEGRGGTAQTDVPKAIPEAKALVLSTSQDCIDALNTGKATATSEDVFSNIGFMKAAPGKYKTIEGYYDHGPIAVGMQKENGGLGDYINKFLADYRASGAEQTSFKKWFGADLPAQD